jgi:hypothetical protein
MMLANVDTKVKGVKDASFSITTHFLAWTTVEILVKTEELNIGKRK